MFAPMTGLPSAYASSTLTGAFSYHSDGKHHRTRAPNDLVQCVPFQIAKKLHVCGQSRCQRAHFFERRSGSRHKQRAAGSGRATDQGSQTLFPRYPAKIYKCLAGRIARCKALRIDKIRYVPELGSRHAPVKEFLDVEATWHNEDVYATAIRAQHSVQNRLCHYDGTEPGRALYAAMHRHVVQTSTPAAFANAVGRQHLILRAGDLQVMQRYHGRNSRAVATGPVSTGRCDGRCCARGRRRVASHPAAGQVCAWLRMSR